MDSQEARKEIVKVLQGGCLPDMATFRNILTQPEQLAAIYAAMIYIAGEFKADEKER